MTKNAKRVAESAQKAKKVGRIIVIKVRYSYCLTLDQTYDLGQDQPRILTPSIGFLVVFLISWRKIVVAFACLVLQLTGLEDQEGRQLDLDDLA